MSEARASRTRVRAPVRGRRRAGSRLGPAATGLGSSLPDRLQSPRMPSRLQAMAEWVKRGRTVQMDERQIVTHDAARAGGSHGNLGPVPPGSEIRVRTRDLDE